MSKYPINTKTVEGYTALYMTAIENHEDLVKLLLKNGADANLKTRIGHAALHAAADNGNKAITLLLLSYGADPTSKNELGYTPLELAKLKRKHKVIRVLQSKKVLTRA